MKANEAHHRSGRLVMPMPPCSGGRRSALTQPLAAKRAPASGSLQVNYSSGSASRELKKGGDSGRRSSSIGCTCRPIGILPWCHGYSCFTPRAGVKAIHAPVPASIEVAAAMTKRLILRMPGTHLHTLCVGGLVQAQLEQCELAHTEPLF